jgi:hypothetical protein
LWLVPSCGVPEYEFWQVATTGSAGLGGFIATKTEAGTGSKTTGSIGGSLDVTDALAAGRSGSVSTGVRTTLTSAGNPGQSNSNPSTGGAGTAGQAVAGLGNGGLSAPNSSAPKPTGGNSSVTQNGGRSATEISAAGELAIAGTFANIGGRAAAGSAGTSGFSQGGKAGQSGAGAAGVAARAGNSASAGSGNFACASYIDLGAFPNRSNTEQAVPVAATCYRFTVTDLMAQLHGVGLYECDTRQSTINGIDCTSGCSTRMPIERTADGYWYIEFAAGKSSSCKAQWWWF